MNKFHLLALIGSAAFVMSNPCSAQSGPVPQVSTVTLLTGKNPDGSMSVITPKGELVPVPGAGVNGNLVEIYMGAQGGFWYTDKTGKTIDLSPTVQALQARRAAATHQNVQVPQYAPEPYVAQNQPTQYVEQSGSSGSSGTSAVATAAAAGLGAMAGTALTNHYYNAPYGTPMYYANGHPYYCNNRQEIDDLSSEQKDALKNHHQQQQVQKQQMVQQGQANRQERMDQRSTNQQNRQQAYQQSQSHNQQQLRAAEQANFQRQQDWYQQQRQENPKRFQQSEHNPFVAQQSGGGRGGRERSGRGEQRAAGRSGGGGQRAAGRSGGGGRRGR